MNTKIILIASVLVCCLVGVAFYQIGINAAYPGLQAEKWLPKGSIQPFSYIIEAFNSTHYGAINHTGYGVNAYEGYEFLSTNASQVIKNAVGNLTSGGTIFVRAGNYTISNSYIDLANAKDIVFEGEGMNATVFYCSFGYHGLVLNSSERITLRDFGLQHAGNSYAQWAIEIEGSKNIFFERVRSFDNGESGFRVTSAGNSQTGARSQNVTFFSCISEGNDLNSTSYGDGFDIAYCDGFSVLNCRSTDNMDSGIGVYYSTEGRIEGCVLAANQGNDGITVRALATGPSQNITISNNIIKYQVLGSGVVVGNNSATGADHSNAVIINNIFINNTGRGILLYTDNNIVSNNQISNSGMQGIEILYGSSNIISNNYIAYSIDDGIEIYGGTSNYAGNNTVTGNIIFNSTDRGINEWGDYVSANYIAGNTFNDNDAVPYYNSTASIWGLGNVINAKPCESMGTNTTAADGGQQTIVIAGTPNFVFITSGNDTNNIVCGAYGLASDHFHYNFNATTGQTVYWWAVYKP